MEENTRIAEESCRKEYKSYLEIHHTISKDIMLAAASLFGILVSLTDSSKDSYEARLFFVLSLSLIALGTLMIGASMLFRLTDSRYQLTRNLWHLHSVRSGTKYVEPSYGKIYISVYTLLRVGIGILCLSMISLVIFVAIRNNVLG